uniref:Dolichyl-diphosphooligosaccharide--protein glycosyltransferase 48 kDa subunit n=1 Tax=Rhabditophanes sp. KR3021 TaxID=114890 RepID=A0AC35U4N8_9BILA
MKFIGAILVLGLLAVCQGAKVLVLVEDASAKETYSIFLESLKARGHELVIRKADNANLALTKFNEKLYDDLIVLAPSVNKFGGSINTAEIASFSDKGGNILVAGSSKVGDAIRELAIEFGFEYDLADTAVTDHFNYDRNLDTGKHTTVVVPKESCIKAKFIVGDVDKEGDILYRGVSLLAHKSNHLILEILTGTSTSYSHNPKIRNKQATIAGKDVVLVGGMQARNNARTVLTGSVDMFSNEFLNAQVQSTSGKKPSLSGNKNLVQELSKWVLQEQGVLRVAKVSHHRVGETVAPEMYTIMNEIEYTITVEELKSGKWVPFTPTDMQFEFVRIDPFVRQTLRKKGNSLTTTFKCPNVNGVYKFYVDYHRPGLTHITDVQVSPVRPLAHDQFERFIRCANPYYASSFSMMAGFVIFSVVFLFYKEEAVVSAGKKTN